MCSPKYGVIHTEAKVPSYAPKQVSAKRFSWGRAQPQRLRSLGQQQARKEEAVPLFEVHMRHLRNDGKPREGEHHFPYHFTAEADKVETLRERLEPLKTSFPTEVPPWGLCNPCTGNHDFCISRWCRFRSRPAVRGKRPHLTLGFEGSFFFLGSDILCFKL